MNRYKTAAPQEKAQSISWFIETKSDVQIQRKYGSKYGKDPRSRSSIRWWHKNFMNRGSVLDAERSGRPRISGENIERVRQAFSRSPMKSIRTASRKLQLLPATVYKVLRKRLRLYAHKMQMLQALSQMTSQNKESLQLICLNEFLRMKHFSSEFVSATKQRFIFLEN